MRQRTGHLDVGYLGAGNEQVRMVVALGGHHVAEHPDWVIKDGLAVLGLEQGEPQVVIELEIHERPGKVARRRR